MRNPAWTRDELILALDLYFRSPAARGSKTHPEVIELSNLLNILPIHAGAKPGDTFRNENGVGMKLSNFLRYDPNYEGKGLERGSKLEEEVWNDFASDLAHLSRVATAIRENAGELGGIAPPADTEFDDEAEASEGKILTRIHKGTERNSKIVRNKKKAVFTETGKLACEACGFDFNEVYGKRGEKFAECHHVVPVSELQPGQKTKVSDLRIVCANCHRMIHRFKPWKSVAEIAELMSNI